MVPFIILIYVSFGICLIANLILLFNKLYVNPSNFCNLFFNILKTVQYYYNNINSGCINRDKNTINNMIKIVKNILKINRPLKFRRDYKLFFLKNKRLILQNVIKASNIIKSKKYNDSISNYNNIK
jgi:hypothetical protein